MLTNYWSVLKAAETDFFESKTNSDAVSSGTETKNAVSGTTSLAIS